MNEGGEEGTFFSTQTINQIDMVLTFLLGEVGRGYTETFGGLSRRCSHDRRRIKLKKTKLGRIPPVLQPYTDLYPNMHPCMEIFTYTFTIIKFEPNVGKYCKYMEHPGP